VAERTSKPTSTYTVGFSDPNVPDERPYARLAAQKFGTQHHETTISAADFSGFLPQYVWHMEEPVCEPPAVALYFVSKMARQFVTVLLSGEGGDEAFAGYSNYRNLVWLERLKRMVSPFRGAASGTVGALTRALRLPRIAQYAPLIRANFPDYYFSRTSSSFRGSQNGVGSLYHHEFERSLDRERVLEPVRKLFAAVKDKSVLDQMLYIDTKTWLPDDLLIKADKMTMANSLELRVPLLDHRVLEFAAALPARYKLKGFATKYLLKKTLARRVPREIIERKKAGFPVPYERWLRENLRDGMRDLLLDRRTIARGYFGRAAIEKLLDANREYGSYAKEVFSLMTLELWHRTFAEQEAAVLA
jgi:asparagine synthase (glutamine-hydrolysing)